MFGPGAVLDVGGSVHISTADQLIFPDQVFSAAPQPNELNLLSSALPQAFGFLADNPAGIDVNGAQLLVDPHDGVAGRTLSLVGGDVTLRVPRVALRAWRHCSGGERRLARHA